MAFSENELIVVDLFVAAYGRAPAKSGLDWFVSKLENGEMSKEDIANYMFDTANNPEAAQRYPSNVSDEEKINTIFNHVLNREVATQEGMDFWTNYLEEHGTAETALAIIEYAHTNEDSKILENKEAVVEYFLEKVPEDMQVGNQISTDEVTADPTTVTQVEAKIDELLQEANTFTLKPEPDNLVGTDGDDTFDGSVVMNPINGDNVNTFTNEDKIDGKDGDDTLIIQHTDPDPDPALVDTVSGTVSDVENIKFTAFAPTIYDMSNTTGVENFVNQDSIALVDVRNANEMKIGVKNTSQNTVVDFDSDAYTKPDDEISLTVENIRSSAHVELKGNDIETVKLESKTAANDIDLFGTALDNTKTLVITGDKDLSIDTFTATGNMDKLANVDASALTGNLDLNLNYSNVTAADNKLDIKGGSGDDVVKITNLTKDDSIDLGAGEDSLVVLLNGTSSITTAPTLANIEKIAFGDFVSNAARTINLDGATEVKEIGVTNVANTNAELKLTSLASSLETVDFLNTTPAGVTNGAIVESVTLKLKDDSADNDALAFNFASVDLKENPLQMEDGKQLYVNKITANGVEDITINTNYLGKDDATTSAVDGGLRISDFNADALKTLTIKSDTLVDLDDNAANLADTISTIDASAANGGVLLDLTNVVDSANSANPSVTVKTGTGADKVLNINGSVNDSISTDAGKDEISLANSVSNRKKVTIDAGADNDKIDVSSQLTWDWAAFAESGKISITTGDGVDIVTVNNTPVADASYNVSISDFTIGTGGDKIDFQFGTASTTYVEKEADGTNTLTADAMNVIYSSANQADSLSHADIAAFLTDAAHGTNLAAANDAAYAVVTDGSDAAVIYIDDGTGNGDGNVDANEITTIATLVGVSKTQDLHADNFSDFL